MAYFLIFVRLSQYTQHRPVGLTVCSPTHEGRLGLHARARSGTGQLQGAAKPSSSRATSADTSAAIPSTTAEGSQKCVQSYTACCAPAFGDLQVPEFKTLSPTSQDGAGSPAAFYSFHSRPYIEHKREKQQRQGVSRKQGDRHSARAAAPPPPGRSRYARSHRTHPRRGLLIAGSLRRFVSSFAG